LRVKVKAEFTIHGLSKREAGSFVRSLEPDNVGLPEGMRISLNCTRKGFKCMLEGELRLSSFIRTWNDLITSIKLLKDLITIIRDQE